MARLKACFGFGGSNSSEAAFADNFIDMSVSQELGRRWCWPRPRAAAAATSAAAAAVRRDRGISWLDMQDWVPPDDADDGHSSSSGSAQCRHCQMRVVPEPSLRWHQRLCAVRADAVPEHCELCFRRFRSAAQASNHYLYGCSPQL
ncbi:hypothetical protein H4R19_003793 [Coemansia spiralis]|nr:hypothetical protein H4R19_003793 [Coemansia spiralis]